MRILKIKSVLGPFWLMKTIIESLVASDRFQQRLTGYLVLPRFWISL